MLVHSTAGMRKVLLVAGVLGLFVATAGVAFFDEVASLRAELVAWEQSAKTADLSDIVERLDAVAAPVFDDVQGDAWFSPYVSSLAEWGIVSGYKGADGKATGQFGPGNAVTVAEVLKMAMNAARVSVEDCPTLAAFKDHWAAAYAGCAQVGGMRVFSIGAAPALDRQATRAETLAIIHDAFDDTVPALYSSYYDTEGNRFESDIAYATLVGMVGGDTGTDGTPTGRFRPDAPINRAEVAKMVYLRLKRQARQEVIGE